MNNVDAFKVFEPGLNAQSGGDAKPKGGASFAYWMSEDLARACNVALFLERPLLVTGEPGTGKTTLAQAVAGRLGRKLETFVARSTSTARDALYQVDTLSRFHDASAAKSQEKPRPFEDYVRPQALGKAIRSGEPHVVLIDEIDKAPRDFPNDLLDVIEHMRFKVDEDPNATEEVAKSRPFVVITSNRERRLPEPFVRRCVYANIKFPSSDDLLEILRLHSSKPEGGEGGEGSPKPGPADEPYLMEIIADFVRVRADATGLSKKPSTSELIDWVKVLTRPEGRARWTAWKKGSSTDGEGHPGSHETLPYREVLAKYPEDFARLGTWR